MQMLLDVIGFALKGTVIVFAVLLITGSIVALAKKGRHHEARVLVRKLNKRFRQRADAVRQAILGRKDFKRYLQQSSKEQKQKKTDKRRCFMMDFRGDIMASAVTTLREEISAIMPIISDKDEVIVRLESVGGVVHGYGLAASQLARIKAKGVRLVICVDKVAASGGYMMACVADEILAAPFAVVGSIGVVASVPNLNRLLEKYGIDYEEVTAGEFKRTMSIFGKISPEGRKKFKEQIEDVHELFKEFINEHRPSLDIAKVATGEYWYGKRALELKLVDRLITSDDYLLSQGDSADIYQVTFKPPQDWRQRMTAAASDTSMQIVDNVVNRLNQRQIL
ncbi:MAG: protease SohB [Deltaproteobacteria bacterium]|nr:protease SohB [Deltaproteobacteria bacterium]